MSVHYLVYVLWQQENSDNSWHFSVSFRGDANPKGSSVNILLFCTVQENAPGQIYCKQDYSKPAKKN